MIGQKNNLELLRKWRMNRAFPRFIIIVGDCGSGRFTLSRTIADILNATIYEAENGIDAVRDVIKTSYTVQSDTIYVFRDCDDMSVAAKNSLLKVVEEPPNNARFIMTVKDVSNVLPTILSRATTITMEPYTEEQLQIAQNDVPIAYMIKSIADTDGERIKTFHEAVEVCENVLTYIEQSSMLGVLRELNKLRAKQDGSGVDPELFLRAFRHDIRDINLPMSVIESFIPYISKCSVDIKKSSSNKKACVEVMCISIVEEVKKHGAEIQ